MTDPEINCVFCGIGFTSLEHVECHISSHHAGMSLEQQQQQYHNHHYCQQQQQQQQYQRPQATKLSVLPFKHTQKLSFTDIIPKSNCYTSNNSKINTSDNLSAKDFIKRAKRPPRLKQFRCSHCLKRYLFKSTIYWHKRSVYKSQMKMDKNTCNKCGFWFQTRQILYLHEEKDCEVTEAVDLINAKNLICQKCETVFTEEKYLKMHKRRNCCQKRLCSRIYRGDYTYSQQSYMDNNVTEEIPPSNYDSADNNSNRTGPPSSTDNSNPPNSSCSSSNKSKSNKKRSKSKGYLSNSKRYFKESSSIESNSMIISNTDTSTNDTNNDNDVENPNSKSNKNSNGSSGGKQRTFKCDVCQKNFSNRSSLSNHIKSHNSRRGQPFVCRECGTRFVNLLSLQDHCRNKCANVTKAVQSTGGEGTVGYHLSNFNGVSQVPLWPNSRTGNVNSCQPVNCVHCNGVFYDRLELEEHAFAQHSTQQGDILCLLCERVFTTNMALRVHLTKSHGFANGGCPGVSQNLPPLPKFGYGLGTKSRRRRREKQLLEMAEEEIKREHLCEHCNRYFNTGQALANHRKACSQSQEVFQTHIFEHRQTYKNPPANPNPLSRSSHTIESLIAETHEPSNNSNRRSVFTNEDNIFLAFN